MKESKQPAQDQWKIARYLLTAACTVIIVLGMKYAADIIVPFLLSAFIAIIITPLFIGMQRRGMPAWLALLILILGLVGVTSIGTVAIGRSVANLVAALPVYQAQMQEKTAELIIWLQDKGVEAPQNVMMDIINPKAVFGMVGQTTSAISAMLGNTFLVLIIVIFMLLEAAVLPEKFRKLSEGSGSVKNGLPLMIDNIRNYMGIKTGLSLATGALAAGLVASLGIASPLIMGLLAFMLNYIPNIGSIIAAIPPVLIALVTLGAGKAALCALGYLVINMTFGNVIEPKVMGKGLGLSPLVIILTMVFWGWILGPVGMLLSVPLTMIVRIVVDSFDETRWIGSLMGGKEEALPND